MPLLFFRDLRRIFIGSEGADFVLQADSTLVKSGRLQQSERILLLVAVAASLAVPLVFHLVPTYSGVSESTDPDTGQTTTVTATATLTEINGMWVLWYAVIPLAATLLIYGLWVAQNPNRGPGLAVRANIGLLVIFATPGALSFGIFFLPVVVCLVAVVIVRQRTRPPAPTLD